MRKDELICYEKEICLSHMMLVRNSLYYLIVIIVPILTHVNEAVWSSRARANAVQVFVTIWQIEGTKRTSGKTLSRLNGLGFHVCLT